MFRGESFSDTPMKVCLKSTYTSEPAMVASKPPVVAALPKTLCCASSADGLESQNVEPEVQSRASPTPIRRENLVSDCDLQATETSAGAATANPSDCITKPTPEDKVLSADPGTPGLLSQHRYPASDQNITFSQMEFGALTPLHIDSIIFEPDRYRSPPRETERGSFCAVPSRSSSMVGENEKEAEQGSCSQLVEALDVHSLFNLGVSSGLRSTPYKLDGEDQKGPEATFQTGTAASAEHTASEGHPEVSSEVQTQHGQAASSPETEKRRVADRIHHFNRLTLHSPGPSRLAQTRSPLKFQRTPVRQTVCRINSLLGESRGCSQTLRRSRRVVKAVSLESGLSPHPHSAEPVELPDSACPIKRPPPIPPRKPSTLSRKPKAGALGDVTNKIQPKSNGSACDPAGAQKPVMQVEKDMNHYRGSPRNPLNQGRLMSATRPVDF